MFIHQIIHSQISQANDSGIRMDLAGPHMLADLVCLLVFNIELGGTFVILYSIGSDLQVL